jgi:sarcosine oxidase, subunit alpha
LAPAPASSGRSIKYHRPRGVWGAWCEDPNAIVDLTSGDDFRPNLRATQVFLKEGAKLSARAVNCNPDARRDRGRYLDAFGRFWPAGFYYKTFIWPSWHRYEPRIRRMAGLGRVQRDWRDRGFPDRRNVACDVLVIGAGPAGLMAAAEAAARGRGVLLLDDRPEPGGSLLYDPVAIDGRDSSAWIADALAKIASAGGRVHSNTNAFGAYEDGRIYAVTSADPFTAPVLHRVDADEVVLATGAIERPLLFCRNDLPGIMSSAAAHYYLTRHGVAVGRRVLHATTHDDSYRMVHAYHAARLDIAVLDARHNSLAIADARARGIDVHTGRLVASAHGNGALRSVRLDDGKWLEADALLVSGGLEPTIQLLRQARGTTRWSDALQAFVLAGETGRIRAVGAANGTYAIERIIEESRTARVMSHAAPVDAGRTAHIRAAVEMRKARRRIWVDLQNDVTVADMVLAVQEGFGAAEHLKRYTTLGMATDQGKTSGLNGTATLASLTGRKETETGSTTARPPFQPVPLNALAGSQRGELFAPLRRLVLEPQHRHAGAMLGEYGGVLRPAHYPSAEESPVLAEARHARTAVGIFDASPLGKIEVIGPDAAAFLDFNFYGRMSTLEPGRIRYGLMLQESGIVYDDGVVTRLDRDRFVVSCSSAHVAGVAARLEEWRQDRFAARRLCIHDATEQWVTLCLTGPRSLMLARELDLGAELRDQVLPHMAFATGSFEGALTRIARVSFTGERSYEISVPAARAEALLDRILRRGEAFGAANIGIEAILLLRAEKGYIIVGKDTDGTTMPQDIGFAAARLKRRDEYVGSRALFTEIAGNPWRRRLVGLEPDGPEMLPAGAHAIVSKNGRPRSIGYVTSSYFSPSMGRPIALALLELAKEGEDGVTVRHLGRDRRARIVAPCFVDPEGARLNA